MTMRQATGKATHLDCLSVDKAASSPIVLAYLRRLAWGAGIAITLTSSGF